MSEQGCLTQTRRYTASRGHTGAAPAHTDAQTHTDMSESSGTEITQAVSNPALKSLSSLCYTCFCCMCAHTTLMCESQQPLLGLSLYFLAFDASSSRLKGP